MSLCLKMKFKHQRQLKYRFTHVTQWNSPLITRFGYARAVDVQKDKHQDGQEMCRHSAFGKLFIY